MNGIKPEDAWTGETRDERESEFLEYERAKRAAESRMRREHEESLKEQDLREWRDGGGEIPG